MSKEKALNSVLLSIVCVILVGLSYAIFKNPIQKILFFVVVIASVISVIYYIVGSKKGKFN
ncbi:hypothetical protein [Acetivibrio saccincola]|jgi:energy-converting hydrogenase Eha subunit C|uniref:Uncharacterized protein n=1 Tax=Acetivibrio saccincola TaxID=1677857 RepID=A0A2K9E8F9_9FIRM|nr:hypothetical protein [Acetivibrio saccincola]AUG58788.1 hypothetical protein HVS_14675 [Acetivibrio saccincola]NLW26294.1 hypothetical protein [Acetivibrio saccincola]PQQ66111.1 hypothetical protein B9R14_04590 [Acetivibrio saccincola]HOA98071.1 hypothetical protein [Acetivibrio saccincola]HQD29730.1 hypothetical protein [Acetivibrio saccincola]